jgi:hypothetical protein
MLNPISTQQDGTLPHWNSFTPAFESSFLKALDNNKTSQQEPWIGACWNFFGQSCSQ